MPQVSKLAQPNIFHYDDFLAWVANHNDVVIGLSSELQGHGPLANWLRSLGFSEVVVTREDILGIYHGEFVDLTPIPGWMQLVMSAEELHSGNITGSSFLITLDSIDI